MPTRHIIENGNISSAISSGGRREIDVGCGTTLGAGEIPERLRAPLLASALGGVARIVEEDEEAIEACDRAAAAAASWAARASATGSVVSPSKNLAIAIWGVISGG